MNDSWVLSHKFILSLNEGDSFYLGNKKHEVTKVNTHKISFVIDGKPFNIIKKKYEDFFYFHSRSIKIRNRMYPEIDNFIRDIEGYIIYLNQIHFLSDKEKKFKEILDRVLEV